MVRGRISEVREVWDKNRDTKDSDLFVMAHPKLTTKKPRRVELKTVPAGRTRSRLIELSQKGIGRKAVHEVTGLDQRCLSKIKNGQTRYVRKETQELVFSVPFNAHSDRALISAGKTWRRINHLKRYEDFTQAEIAKRLGAKQNRLHPTLHVGRKRVTAKTAMKIEKLYNDARAA